MFKNVAVVAAVVLVLACSIEALGRVQVEWVAVGDSGNADDTHGSGYGGVGYDYRIGKYEVTAGQYTEFLCAVASDDTYGLYNSGMWTTVNGCKIDRSGSDGSYTYSVAGDRANRPVNYVSFWDICRFANWLHNDQPTGAQDLTTTEDGAYFLNAAMTNPENWSVSREADAKVWIPSEDEWYKAAYYKSGGTNAGYWGYQTQSDVVPTAESPPGTDMVNGSANYGNGVDPTYYTTEVGAYDARPSASAYGTFDQGGNVREWNEAISSAYYRGSRGGAFNSDDGSYLHASYSATSWMAYEGNDIGFRVGGVPEPATMGLLALGALGLLRRRRKAKR